jgi:hypothetical protein
VKVVHPFFYEPKNGKTCLVCAIYF